MSPLGQMNMADSSDAYCFHISLKDFKHEPDYLSTIYTVNCVLHTSFAVLTIFGNTTVLVSIWKTPSLYTPSTVLLASLALSDLAVDALVQLAYLPYKVAELYQDFTYCVSYGFCLTSVDFSCLFFPVLL